MFIYFLWSLMSENCRLVLIVKMKYEQKKYYYLEGNLIVLGWLKELTSKEI